MMVAKMVASRNLDRIREQIQEAFERALEPIRPKPEPIDIDVLYEAAIRSLSR